MVPGREKEGKSVEGTFMSRFMSDGQRTVTPPGELWETAQDTSAVSCPRSRVLGTRIIGLPSIIGCGLLDPGGANLWHVQPVRSTK